MLAGTCAPRPGRKPAPSVFLCPATSTESNSALVLFPKLCNLTQTRCWALGQSALGCSGVSQSHEHHMHQLQILTIVQALCCFCRQQVGAVAHGEPNISLFILPEANVCGAGWHLIRSLGTWELTEQKEAEQEQWGWRGKRNTLRCLGCSSQLPPTQEESFVCPALDATTTRSLFSQTLLVLKATTHTSVPRLRRKA